MLNSIALMLTITLMYSATLIFGALGGVVSERSGVVNIGIEGMMVIGAFAGAAAGYYSANPWIGFLAAGLAGGLLATAHAVACVTFRANQTVSGVAMNFLGPGLALFLSRLLFEGATMTKPVPETLPKIFSSANLADNELLRMFNFDVTIFLALFATFALWFVMYKTKWGLRLLAVGEHPAAADTLGINVYLVRYIAVIMSGVLAGFGGAAQTLAVVSVFSPTVISGHGFIALAAVIFGKWTPHGSALACMFFGFSQALVVMFSGSDALVPSQILAMLPYVLTIIVLIVFVGRSKAPAASGVPYIKGSR